MESKRSPIDSDRYEIGWGTRQLTVANDEAAVHRAFAEAALTSSSDRSLVHVWAPNGAHIGVGLADGMAVLTYESSPDPPYFVSKGPSDEEDPSLVFFSDGHHTEFSRSAAVPEKDALEAVRSFIDTQLRPENVDWQEV